MRRIFAFVAAAAMLMTACVKENAPIDNVSEEALVPMEFVATSDLDTKTTLVPGENNKTSVIWNADDKISVWDGTANREFTIKSCDGSSAVFTGLVSADATSFYAVYPYTADLEVSAPDNAERDIRLRFPITSVEYAQPGNFPKDRGIAVAVAVDGAFAFQNRTALLKFSLAEDMADVKSVTIKGNNSEYIWGTVNIEFAGTSVYQGMAYGYDRGDSITLCNEDGSNLQTGVDYYIALPGIKFSNGFTVSVLHADNTISSKTSETAIQMYTKNIYSLASAPLSKSMFDATEDAGDPETSYYAAYMAGQDITVAGKVYNNTTHPGGQLLTETTTITADGIYFVKPSEGASISFGGSRLGDVVVIGDVPGTRQVLGDAQIKIKLSGKVAVMNCCIEYTGTAQLIDENKTASYVAFDDCTIVHTNGKPMCYASGADGTMITEFVMVNSEYKVPETASQNSAGTFFFNGGLTGSTLRFENNVFYVDKADVSTLKFKFTTQATAAASLVMKNNTFVNILANDGDSGFFKNGVTFTNIDVQNNLFYVPGMTRNNTVFMTGTDFGAGVTANNAYYRGENTFTFRMFNGTDGTPEFAQTDLTGLDSSPFSSMDHTNGVFVKSSEASAYGATR